MFEKALVQDGAIVLDGGLATELEAQGCDIGNELWSASMLRSNPSAIVDAHVAFLEAGANIIISASYQASRKGFMPLGLSEQQADDLIVRSVDLAHTAREKFLDAHADASFMPMVAASIGPYGAVVHDGSEYTGNYDVDEEGLRQFHSGRLHLLDRSGADVLACETIPNCSEAGVLHDLLMDSESPAWVSFACRDERCISDGTPLQEVAEKFRDHPRVLALGINCTAPHLITSLIGEIRQAAPNKAIVVYPNSGEKYEVKNNSWHGSDSSIDCAEESRAWVSAGAKIIGGCCRVSPENISAMSRNLHS